MIAATFLIVFGAYAACGVVFAVPFAWRGAGRIDPRAGRANWGFRLLVIPGAVALWPLLLRRWVAGVKEPPEEIVAHRLAAKNGNSA
jgi:hypothetical protein